ncbi:MAG: CotS family spore coat protein [Clostridiales bacterium]
MENTVREILHNYPIHFDRIVTLKSEKIWEINAQEGSFILKALPYPKEETDFIIGAMKHLQAENFTHFNAVLPTLNHKDTLAHSGQFFFLTKTIEGREASFINEEDAPNLGEFLAHFHKATRGYHPQAPYPGRIKWGNWDKMIENKKTDLIKFQETSPKKGDFNRIFRRFVPYYLEEANIAQDYFKTTEYMEICREEEKSGGFCHHDLAHHNFIINETPNLIDFDYVLADIRCHDIANILCKILKMNHWDIKIAFATLVAYDKASALKKAEIPILKAMLRFPQDFWQCGFARYEENDATSRNEKKLRHWVKERTLRKEALEKLETMF